MATSKDISLAVDILSEVKAGWEQLQWIGDEPLEAEIDRVAIRDADYLTDIVLEVPGASSVRVLGEIVGAAADTRAASLSSSLRKPSRGQLKPDEAGVSALPALGLVVRRPGLDKRIPALELLHRPERAVEALSHLLGDTHPHVELLGHRLGKRAVLRASTSEKSVIIKGYKARADLPLKVFQWAKRLASVQGDSPAAIETLGGHNAVVWEDLGSITADEWGTVRFESEVEAIGNTLRRLHQVTGLELPKHGVSDEIATLDRLNALVEVARPELAHAVRAAFARVKRGLTSVDADAHTLTHRDAHPGQFAQRGGRVSLIDLDTLSMADPALDLGNYAAYLTIGGLRAWEPALHSGYQSDGVMQSRAERWRDASLLRLGMMCSLTTTRSELGRRTIEKLSELETG
jgi:hypothetical protein